MVPHSATVKKFCQNVCIQFRTGSIATTSPIVVSVVFAYTVANRSCQNNSLCDLKDQSFHSLSSESIRTEPGVIKKLYGRSDPMPSKRKLK